MIILDEFQQGSLEWMDARRGIPTASRFSDIVTPTGKLSASRTAYMHELIGEWHSGESAQEFGGTRWTERGQMYEDRARSYYEFVRGGSARRVGFVYRDESRTVGCSPDWLVGREPWDTTCPQAWVRGAEVKCPKLGTHVGWILAGDEMPPAHRAQVQGCLWVTGLDVWDFVSYYPGQPMAIISVERSPQFQQALDDAIPQFIEEMLAGRERYAAYVAEREDARRARL